MVRYTGDLVNKDPSVDLQIEPDDGALSAEDLDRKHSRVMFVPRDQDSSGCVPLLSWSF